MQQQTLQYKPGDLVSARGREWVVLPELRDNVLRLRPLGGAEGDATLIFLPLEREPPTAARFSYPDSSKHGTLASAALLFDAVRLKLRAGAGPFRSFGNLSVEPRIYQLVPLLMALKLDPVRLLIADDVGIGKTIEAGLIVRELIDRGEIDQCCVICPPHLCDQWQRELGSKFGLDAVIVRTGTAARLERGLLPGESIFEVHPYTILSLDYIKSDRRYAEFVHRCPSFVVIDEAHTCVRQTVVGRHQRHRLVRSLADNPRRNLLLLTATPHCGNDTAFHALLGLLDRRFESLQTLDKSPARDALREELSKHFVQRRRGDVVQSGDGAHFPRRESAEVSYVLTGQWQKLFADVMDYARELVVRAEGGTRQQQRMSWWAALAVMRCVSSSPAAAQAALRNRLSEPSGADEHSRIRQIDLQGQREVTDEADADELTASDVSPAGTLDTYDDDEKLRKLIGRAGQLRGVNHDPKIKKLVRDVRILIRSSFRPVIFCRFIATAHYLGEQLRSSLPKTKTHVEIVTGELTSHEREERIAALMDLPARLTPVLVATDCLSEGVNLQDIFNAVVHYDLTWNPTRHEQREGRVDRFGQHSDVVRTMMLYGSNNPVDGAVIQVILRKAEAIRRELGVAVPLPVDNSKLLDTIMRAALFNQADSAQARQLALDFKDLDTEVEREWREAKQKASRTIFAQQSIKPEVVLSEWRKAAAVLGGETDVARFVTSTALRLGAPLDTGSNGSRIPVTHLPEQLRDLLEGVGVQSDTRFSFTLPAPPGALHLHRSHPVVSTFADFVAEQALEAEEASFAARCTAIITDRVEVRTILFLLRLRSQIAVERHEAGRRYTAERTLLAEECICVEVAPDLPPAVLSPESALERMRWQPRGNVPEGRKTRLVKRALADLKALQPALDQIARQRALAVQEDHRRVREAARIRSLRYRVTPALPADVLGVYVFVPVFRFDV